MRLTHASVFSGIGGPEIAATMLGWDNAFHCEINEFGRKILEYWYPNSRSYEDITKTDFSEWRGMVDVLTGGFPCQPFSYAGQRRGAEDDRYLWPHMFRCIDQVRPTWVVAENVAGILTMVEQGEVSKVASPASLFAEINDVRGQYQLRETFTLQRICTDLEGHGYAVQPILIQACAVGAPHRRDRVFIVARRIASDSDNRTDRRTAGEDEGKGRAQRVQERHEVRKPDEPNQVRREGERYASSDTDNDGLERHGGQELQSHQGGQAADEHAACGSGRLAPHPDSHRGREVDEHMESELADGAKPLSNGGQRNVADTSSDGLQHDDFGGSQIEAFRRRTLELLYASATTDGSGRGVGEYSNHAGERWANFPTVSPVHRGNDGLPFSLDDLAIPASKWRNESLKAYGNAIVPQVMYEIFRAIEIVELENL